MVDELDTAVYHRPLWWPLAALVAAAVFFTVYVGVASLLAFLSPPDPGTGTVFQGDMEMPRQLVLYAALGLLIGFPSAQSVYRVLRGKDAVEAVADAFLEVAKISVASVTWLLVGFALLWLAGRDGGFGIVGLVLLLCWGVGSIVFFAAMYQAHTPPTLPKPEMDVKEARDE